MKTWKVNWVERTYGWCQVEAESAQEAIEKAKRGEVIEGTQDTEPGQIDESTIRAYPQD